MKIGKKRLDFDKLEIEIVVNGSLHDALSQNHFENIRKQGHSDQEILKMIGTMCTETLPFDIKKVNFLYEGKKLDI